MVTRVTMLCFLAGLSTMAAAEEARVVFQGTPKLRAIVTPTGAEAVPLDEKYASQKRVIITEKNSKYYWASRENKVMFRKESGSYITYVSADGAGYVRTLTPGMSEMKSKLPPEMKAGEVDYLEQLVQQFDTITFFGDKD